MVNIEQALWQDDDRMSGAVCFRGTRVPVSIMFEFLEANQMDEFYGGYPNVSKDQVTAVLEASKKFVEGSFRALA
jgi:uncharacterized protein (DUF433 family)